jgi:type I restriction enzyme S subunit
MSVVMMQRKPTDTYGQPEADLYPTDWVESCLGDCGDIIMGQSPPGTSYNRLGVGSPLINGPTEFTDLHPIKIQWTTQPVRFCKPGDLLICVRGSSTGRTNYADDVYAIGRGVAAIRAKDNNDTKFLSYQVISGVSDIISAATGSTFPSVDAASFMKIIIPLPHPREQRAIAEALSDVDALIGVLETLVAKKRAIKQAAIQQLLTGKTRLPGFEARPRYKQTDVGVIPEDWEVQHLSDIGEALAGLTYSPEDVAEYGTLVLRSSNIQEGGLSFTDNVFVDMDLPARVITKEGDILICVRNGSRQLIGKCAIIDKEAAGSAFGAFMAVFRPKNSAFAFYQFQSDVIQRQIRERMGATINQITNRDMTEFLIPVPPAEAEQRAIASVLADMDAEIAALKKRCDKTREIKKGIMQQLLTGRIRLVKPAPSEDEIC